MDHVKAAKLVNECTKKMWGPTLEVLPLSDHQVCCVLVMILLSACHVAAASVVCHLLLLSLGLCGGTCGCHTLQLAFAHQSPRLAPSRDEGCGADSVQLVAIADPSLAGGAV
jgi:hypothetical protein